MAQFPLLGLRLDGWYTRRPRTGPSPNGRTRTGDRDAGVTGVPRGLPLPRGAAAVAGRGAARNRPGMDRKPAGPTRYTPLLSRAPRQMTSRKMT
ncbi:hypothetical protein GCM10010512_51870 [Streptomyces thermoviolaceus subsp. thermoviolaceus]|nr:hypothetical protein GCM10010512_51870 [Streptomyces thermoviolaceus subsp. thermoviolaceus]